jgi:putative nucleotidyltransferase with HDIG domain
MDQIPTLSVIVSRLIKVVNSSDSSAGNVADLIERDPALTSKVLRLANSAFYGVPRSVSSVQSAVVILGFNTLKSIVLSASIFNLFSSKKTPQAFDRTRFWKHSIVCALAAKKVAQSKMSRIGLDPQSAFCAGIMHDIGKLIFELFTPDEYSNLCEHAVRKKIPLIEAEIEVLGLSHADIGRILADKWALPIDLEYAIVHHHKPQAMKKIKELVSLVNVADSIAHDLQCGLLDEETPPQGRREARDILFLDDVQYRGIVDSMSEESDEFKEFLSIIKE